MVAANPFDIAELERRIESSRAAWSNVGVAVSVVLGGEVLLARGFGARQFGLTSPVNGDTLFQVGSTTKAFTTAALALLVDEGRLGWDDRIIDWLPRFRLKDPWLTRELTIRDAASHRSGFSHSPWPFLAVMSRDEVIGQLRHLLPEGRFRDCFVYSNLMYALLGQVIESASGIGWDEFIASRLFRPLRMHRSRTSPYSVWQVEHVAPTFLGTARTERPTMTLARDTNVAMPHRRSLDGQTHVLPWQSYDNAAPAGAVISSAADMARWMILYAGEDRFDGAPLISPQTLHELTAPQNAKAPRSAPPLSSEGAYTLGWFRTQYAGQVCLLHGGGMLGFPAFVALLPEKKLGVAVLSNTSGTEDALFLKSIVFEVFDLTLGAAPQQWATQFTNQLRATEATRRKAILAEQNSRIPDTRPSRPLDDYAGLYRCLRACPEDITIAHRGGRLYLRFAGEGAFSAELQHWHHDVFRVASDIADEVFGSQFATFSLGPQGRVTAVEAFSAIFHKV